MSLMPSCKDITEQSSNYLDSHMPLMKRLGFKMHMFVCVNCKRYVSQLKLTIDTIGKIQNTAPQPVDDEKVQEIVKGLHQHIGNKD